MSSPSGDRPSLPSEIKITPEMIRAGEIELIGYDPAFDSTKDLVTRIFAAMAAKCGISAVAGEESAPGR